MGVKLGDLVDESTLAELRARADEAEPETKAAPASTAPGGVASKKRREEAIARAERQPGTRASGSERDYVRDGVGQFASTGKRDSAVAGGPDAGRAPARAKDDDEKDKPAGPGRRRTADGGIDRDGDGDSDPALNEEGFAKIGDLDDLNRQVANWEDNVPPEKRREQRIRMLARAAELGASDKMLARIRALPAPPPKAKGGPTKDSKADVGLEFKDASSTEIEHKADPGLGGAQVLEADEDTGVVVALVSVTGVEDKVKDIIEPGAYTKTMQQREPIGVWSHDDKTWVARTEEAVELMPGDPFLRDLKTMDGKPWPKEAGAVKVKARFNLETPHGAAAFSDVKFFEGKTGWSIGYRATKAARNVRTGVRRIKELDWFEYSPVMVGAADQPMTLSVKSMSGAHTVDPDEAKGLFEEVYDELTGDELLRLSELKASLGLEVKARVRTKEGAQHYGQPIGSVIIPDSVSGGSLAASALDKGMTVEFTNPGSSGAGSSTKVKGTISAVSRDGNVTTVTVNGEDHKLIGDSPVKVTDGAPANAPLRDIDLVAMIKEADDDDERALLRQAAALPAEKRRAFLQSGGKTDGGDAAPKAGAPKGGSGFAGSLSGGPKLTPGTPEADAQAERIMKLHEGKRTTPVNGKRIIEQAKAGHLLETVPDGDTGMVIIKRKGSGSSAPAKGDGAPKAGGSSLSDMSDDDLFDEITKVGRISGKDATDADRKRLVDLSNERHRRAETGQGRFGKLKGKTRAIDTGDVGGAKPASKVPEKPEGKPGAEPDKKVVNAVGTLLDAFRDEEGPSDPDVRALDKLLAAYEVEPSDANKDALRKFLDETENLQGNNVFADRAKASLGGGSAKPAAAKPAGGDGGFKEPANDKGETVSDFVEATLSDIRDEEYRQLESDVQAVFDRWKKSPSSATTSALISQLSSINEDGIDGEKIDDAIALLEELLKSRAYGGSGRKADDDLEHKGSRASLDRSPRKNWVEMAGGLPGYFREVARSIAQEHGIPLDRAIPMAIGRIKKWARGGGNVKPDTIAKAAAAVAQWTKMKTQKGYDFDSELLEELEAKGWQAVDVYEALLADGIEAKDMLAVELLEPEPVETKAGVTTLEPDVLERAGELKAGSWSAEPDPTIDFMEALRRREALSAD